MPEEELRHEIEQGVMFWGEEEASELVAVMGIQDVGDVTLIRPKLSRLRVTGERRRGGVPKGTPRSERYGKGRTRAVPSLPLVLEGNRLPLVPSLPIGEMKMLERKERVPFYQELQTASRIQANTRKVKGEENAEPQLTQS